MRFTNLRGYPVHKNIEKNRIDWDGKSLSKFQFNVKQFLRPHWINHVVYEEIPLAGTRLSLDFLNFTRRLAVEVHGDQHRQFVKFFHGKREGLTDQIKRDMQKLEWLEINDFQLIEIYTDDMPLTKQWFKKTYDIIL